MSLPITIPNTFATETTNIPLSDLDANFTTVANGVNGIGNGTNALANVAVTGGSIANVSATNVTANVVSISNATITGGSITGITPIAVVAGGTGANSAATARTNLSAAASGSNSDITSLSGLTTALSVAQGGTGSANLTANSVVIGNGTSAVSGVAPGTSGNLLTSNGTSWTSSAPAAVGVSQTWQSVTRTAGTTYTNDTGKPICFLMSFASSSGSNEYITLTVGGTAIPFIYGVVVDGVVFGQNMAIIPVGATYSYAQLTSVGKSIYELR
jgi:hypothetical protein